ncbi:MAG: glycosyltransferase family 9 protein [Thermodesulfobacteriota bacterium]|nr:glycosyltransferase family 9 protein [Thermodesulfobacteriota bacterium]
MTLKVLIVYLFFFPMLIARRRKRSSSAKKILYIRLDRFGDMVLTLPTLSILRKYYPAAELTVLCSPSGAVVLNTQPNLVDNVIVWNGIWDMHGGLILNAKHFFLILGKIYQLRKNSYDYVFQPVSLGIWTLLATSLRADRVVARVDKNLLLPRLLINFVDNAVVINERGRDVHVMRQNLECAFSSGIKKVDLEPLTLAHRNVAVQNFSIDLSEKLIFNVSAGDPVRQLPIDVAAKLTEKILSSFNHLGVVLIGVSNDSTYAADLFAKFPERVENCVGQTNVDDLIYIFKKAPLLVTSDTGSMHLAAMTDIHIVAYFTAGSLRHFAPVTDNCTIIQHELGCSGCGDMCFTEEMPKPCMAAITADELFDAVSAVLESKKVAAG